MYKKLLKIFVILILIFNACSIGKIYSYAVSKSENFNQSSNPDIIKDTTNSSIEFIDNSYFEESNNKSILSPGFYAGTIGGGDVNDRAVKGVIEVSGGETLNVRSVQVKTTDGCELSKPSEAAGVWRNYAFIATVGAEQPVSSSSIEIQPHLAMYNFNSAPITKGDFSGGTHIKITSDYYVTIEIYFDQYGASPIVFGPYKNFFGDPQQGAVQVKYVDEQGREVAPTETLTGNVGEKYETQAKEIPGYALKEKPSNATGTYKEETQTVTYVYKRQQGVVQVKYVDEQGREVAPTETLTGNVGEKYETQAKEIPGYALKEKPSNATGTYKEETQTVTYVYNPQQGAVQVKYVDEQGREVAPTETLTGNVGEKYETQAKEIPGYA
ncbi:hypothetical protein GUJ10_13495, partial [Enterococcus faecalis]|uniref:MucBP domain-containing protein n=2 Tax=Enterococcus faecalis TaxID=1351 RepID=UPI00136FFB7A